MPVITAAQHFFSSVPAEQSPQKRRGYQTLFVTGRVPDEILRTIEDRAQYVTATGDPIKRQFYALPGDLAAISQTVPLAELDEFGRRGRYLAHTLILPLKSLAPFGYCPLDILSQFSFARNLEDVFGLCGSKRDSAPQVSADITVTWPHAAHRLSQSLPSATLSQLGRLTWQAHHLRERHEPVALIGSGEDQLALLGLCFLLASPYERGQLSFDTHAAGCEWAPSVTFWAQGYAVQAGGGGNARVDVAARTVTSDLHPAQDGVFGSWMVREVIAARMDTALLREQDRMGRLAVVLAGKPLPVGPEIPPDFLERFARQNQGAVLSALGSRLPAGLSSELSQTLMTDLARDPGSAMRWLIEGLSPRSLSEILFFSLAILGAPPAKNDRHVLDRWLQSNFHPGLTVLQALWNKDAKAWERALYALPPEDYRYLLEALAGWRKSPIPLWEALLPGRESDWLTACAVDLAPADWKKVLSILQKQEALPGLAAHTARLSEPAREEIRKWLKGYRGDASALRAAVGVPPAGSKRGFWPF